jgi:hypothetical protein
VDTEIVTYLWRLRPVLSDEAPPQAPPVRQAPRQPLITNDPGASQVPAFGAPSSVFGAPATPPRPPAPQPRAPQPARVGGDDAEVKTVRNEGPKVGRNDPCPCGSGKKYKKCHGAAA